MNKRKKAKSKSKWGLLIMAGLLVYFAYLVFEQEKVLDGKMTEMNTVESKIKEEQKLNEDLKNQKETLDSDESVERIAREKLGMVKPGEKVYVDVNR